MSHTETRFCTACGRSVLEDRAVFDGFRPYHPTCAPDDADAERPGGGDGA